MEVKSILAGKGMCDKHAVECLVEFLDWATVKNYLCSAIDEHDMAEEFSAFIDRRHPEAGAAETRSDAEMEEEDRQFLLELQAMVSDSPSSGCESEADEDVEWGVSFHTLWTVQKGGVTIELTLQDIVGLLQGLNRSEHLGVFDERTTKFFAMGPDEVGVGLNGNCVQITLFRD